MVLWIVVIGGLAVCWIAINGLRRRLERIERLLEEGALHPTVGSTPAPRPVQSQAAAPVPTPVAPKIYTAAPKPVGITPATAPAPSPAVSSFPHSYEPEPQAHLVDEALTIGGRTMVRDRHRGARHDGAARWQQPKNLESLLRSAARGKEWEEVIGGSWLNKLGVLVLVIGVALFVAYSMTAMGPAGRVSVGLLVAFTLLVGGVVLERHANYVTYARGLIGGGWAALYFTTYAAHALEAARVIDNPLPATALLMVVAFGMIVHSLRYRSEIVTGMAYFVGFATLAVTPITEFAVIASVPLALSLLAVAQRFQWQTMATVGLIVTYGTYLFSVAAAPAGRLIVGQSVVTIYWLMFEGFDLLAVAETRSDGRRTAVQIALFPLNCCAFIGISLLQWSPSVPILLFLTPGAFLFLADSMIRAAIHHPSSFRRSEFDLVRVAQGGYEASVTVAVALATAALYENFSGQRLNLALMLEAETLIIVGVQLGLAYPRMLGSVVIAMAVAKLLMMMDPGQRRSVVVEGFALYAWSPLLALTAGVLYLDRWLVSDRWKSAFGYVALLLLVLLINFEIPADYRGLGWLILGECLFESGLLLSAGDLRVQGYGAGALGLLAMLWLSMVGGRDISVPGQKIALAAGTVLIYGAAIQAYVRRAGWSSEEERIQVRDLTFVVGAALAATMFWYLAPVPLLAIGWILLALTQIELGCAFALPVLRVAGYCSAALAYGRLFFANFAIVGDTFGISHRLLTVVPVSVILYYLFDRLDSETKSGRISSGESLLSRASLHGATFLLVVLIRFEAGRVLAVIAWSLLALALLVMGLQWSMRELRWQSYLIALLTFFRSWATNFFIPGSLAGLPTRVVTAAFVIAILYACELLYPRTMSGESDRATHFVEEELDWIDRNARTFFSCLASVLLAALLYHEVSASALTEAWALEGVPLLVAGFALRERVMRLSGLAILSICVLKVFIYDLSNLETLARIFSFIVLGILLLGVSFIYTRYYERLRRFL